MWTQVSSHMNMEFQSYINQKVSIRLLRGSKILIVYILMFPRSLHISCGQLMHDDQKANWHQISFSTFNLKWNTVSTICYPWVLYLNLRKHDMAFSVDTDNW